MSITLNPYLSFRDNAREAMDFYRTVFGGELTVSTFADFQASQEPDDQDLVMHAQLDTPAGLTLMASDTPKHREYAPGTAISVSVSGPPADDAALRGYWEGLSEGARVDMPLARAMWGGEFGMLTDRFGVAWMVNINAAAS